MKDTDIMRNAGRIICAVALAAMLAACGARGALEPPPDAPANPDPDPPFVLDPLVE